MKKFKYDLTDEEDIEKLFFDTAKIFGIIFVILLIWSGFELLYFDKVNNYTKQLVLTADKKYENRKILGLSTDNITCSNVMNKNLHFLYNKSADPPVSALFLFLLFKFISIAHIYTLISAFAPRSSLLASLIGLITFFRKFST